MRNDLQRSDGGIKGFLKSFLMTQAERANKVNRGIAEYKPHSIEAFFEPQLGVYNTVVSGGESVFRNCAVCAQISGALQNNLPVVVLHEGDRSLEEDLRNQFGGTNQFVEISERSPRFEPMYMLNEMEIANEVVQSAPKDYDLKFNVKYYLDGVSTFMAKTGKKLSFRMFATCPHTQIFDKVDNAQMRGLLSDTEAQEIKSKLMMGQSENFKLDSVLANLQMEMEPIMWTKNNGYKPANIISAVKAGQILCLDVLSVSNTLLMNVLIYQMKLASTRGLPFVLVVDSLSANSNEQYLNFLKTGSKKVAWTIVSDDLYAMVGGEDKLFDSLVGNSQLLVVLSHTMGNSAKKWADTIGQYDAWIETYSKTSGSSQVRPTSFLTTFNRSSTVNTNKNREYIVKPEQFARMMPGEAYIMSQIYQELAHIQLTL